MSEAKTWADDANSAAAPAWTSLNVRAGVPFLGVRAFGGVRNALDARIVGSVNVNGANRRFFEPAPGRTWYMGVETKIGGY